MYQTAALTNLSWDFYPSPILFWLSGRHESVPLRHFNSAVFSTPGYPLALSDSTSNMSVSQDLVFLQLSPGAITAQLKYAVWLRPWSCSNKNIALDIQPSYSTVTMRQNNPAHLAARGGALCAFPWHISSHTTCYRCISNVIIPGA